MTDKTTWLALREAAKLSQREVERRLGWDKRGHLSLIERGITPSAAQEAQLRSFYASVLLAPADNAIQTAYDEGRIADGQDLNREAGIAAGGSVESGGAVR